MYIFLMWFQKVAISFKLNIEIFSNFFVQENIEQSAIQSYNLTARNIFSTHKMNVFKWHWFAFEETAQ